MKIQVNNVGDRFLDLRNVSITPFLRRTLRAREQAAVTVADRVAPVGVSVPEISAARCGLREYFETADEFEAYLAARRAAVRGASL